MDCRSPSGIKLNGQYVRTDQSQIGTDRVLTTQDHFQGPELPLEPGLLSGLIPCQDRPQRPRSSPRPPTEAPRQHGPPTEAPRAAQDRQHPSQERPKTANISPKSGPGPPTEAPRGQHRNRESRILMPICFFICLHCNYAYI